MEEWKEYKLGEISEIQTGPFGSQLHQSDYVEKGTPCIMPTNIGSQLEIKTNGIAHVKDEDVARLHRHCVKVGDIIYSRRGDIEKCAYINQHEEGWLCGTGCLRIRVNAEKATPHFVAYQLATKTCKRWVANNAVGTTMPNLNTGILKELPLLLPPMDVQMQSVSVLSALDDKIAINRRICENLEAQAQALFKHWFIDFAPFKNGKFVESELGMIPEGWRVGRLEELCSFISRGLSPKYQSGTNEWVLGQTCVRNNVVTLNNAREHQPKANSNKYVKKWDVLLNSTGIGSLGRVGVVYFDNKNVCFDSHLTVVRTAEEIHRYYVGRNLLNRQKELENMAVGSTGQTELPKKDVIVMPILIPNSDILPEFNEIIENIGNKIYTLIEENLCLSTLRDTLLPKLMSGQIKV